MRLSGISIDRRQPQPIQATLVHDTTICLASITWHARILVIYLQPAGDQRGAARERYGIF